MTSVPREQWPSFINKLNASNAWGISRFSDPEYLDRRLDTEKRIRNEFISIGGKPALEHPIYFFLGRNARFEEHEMNKGYLIRLDDIPLESISFTYGDSMFSLNEDYRIQMGEKYQNSLCGRVFRKIDLENIFSNLGYPANEPLNIEAQLWINPHPEIVKILEPRDERLRTKN